MLQVPQYLFLLLYWACCIVAYVVTMRGHPLPINTTHSVYVYALVVVLNFASTLLLRAVPGSTSGVVFAYLPDFVATACFVVYVLRGGAYVVGFPLLMLRFRDAELVANFIKSSRQPRGSCG